MAVDGSGNVYIGDSSNTLREWSVSTGQWTTLAPLSVGSLNGLAVDGSGSVYFSTGANINDDPQRLRGTSQPDRTGRGFGSLLPVVPSTMPITGVFAPTSDQTWLFFAPYGPSEPGVVTFWYMANQSTSPRVAHITLFGQQITVTQTNGWEAQTIAFGPFDNLLLGAAPFQVSATASSGYTVSLSSTTSSVCTLAGSTVTLGATGTCTLQATQAGDATYMPATVNQSFRVMTGSLCDVNQAGGGMTIADVERLIAGALGVNPAGDDMNMDGAVNIADVQIVLKAAMGGTCMAK